MGKKPNLAAALAANKEPSQTAPAPTAAAANSSRSDGRASSRSGQTNISAWFDPSVKLTLEELRLQRQRGLGRRVTLQELMGEAFNDIFKKYGLPEVAPTKD